jgi:hypothetical protein
MLLIFETPYQYLCSIKVKQKFFIMKLKYFSLFLLFLLGMQGAIAKGSISNLPAPGNFVNTVNEPTFVAFTFSPVQGATGYQVQITYPSGASGQTFQSNDPNDSYFSATVLNEPITVSIAAIEGSEVSPNLAIVMVDKIIIMDLVAGLSPPDELGDILCEHGLLSTGQKLLCNIPTDIDHSFIFEFMEGNELIQLKWKNKILANYTRKIEAQLCTEDAFGWSFNDGCSSIFASPFIPCNTSEYIYITKSDRMGRAAEIRISGTPAGERNNITIGRTGSNPIVIENIKIYDDLSGQFRSDNQTTQSSNEYKVTPNPFSDHLNITIDTPEKGEVVVNLFDVTGSLRKTVTLPANELDNQNYTIATSDLLAGMYIMHVRTSAGVQQVSKVFKL